MRWIRQKLQIFVALLISVTPLFALEKTAAAVLTPRSIEIGSSAESAITSHTLSFTIPTAGPIGSIEFEYCSNDPFVGNVCTAPTGLSLSGASLASQTGETGFSIHGSSTINKLIITRAASPNLAFQPVEYTFNNVLNQQIVNPTVFVRISTFASTDATGSRVDSGAVAYSVARGIAVEGFVPPYLRFCVGLAVSADCTNVSGSFIQLGELSKTNANTGTSQFSGSTNDPGGYSTFLAGKTMTSGNNVITALSTPQPSLPGTSQFGLNLVANSNPSLGQNPAGTGTLTPTSGYATPNLFKFANQVIASSSLPTNPNVITVSYVTNVSNSQAPGIYSTTMTYIATAAF
ncbi:hypothetical protein HZB74_02220 [Candidatus Saccharibacteria bacterium]|nr:hypothetical protein [Candidatus Saccharibacteria bacterium]